MEYLENIYGVLLIVGIITVTVVVVLAIKRKKSLQPVFTGDSKTPPKVINRAETLVTLSADSLMAYLEPLKDDQPLFIQAVGNLLKQARSSLHISIIKQVIAELNVQNELLRAIDEYEVNMHTIERKSTDFAHGDAIKDLEHERNMQQLLNEIATLKNNAGSINDQHEGKLKRYEAEITYEYKIREIWDRISGYYEKEKRERKFKELNDMTKMFENNADAINSNPNLTPAVRKEALRTLEQTFIAQLDEFKRGL